MSSTDKSTDTVTVAHDGQCVSDGIVDAVASALGTDPIQLPPLQYTIDVDALDGLWRNQTEDSFLDLAFDYADCRVEVEIDVGHITVTPQAG